MALARISFFSLWLLWLFLLLKINSNTQAAPVSGSEKPALYQGDIILTDPQRSIIETLAPMGGRPLHSPGGPHTPPAMNEPGIQHAVARLDSLKWTNGIVPYTLDSTLTPQMVTAIRDAINDFENKTCVRFVPRTVNDTDYVRFSYGHSCSSLIGRVGGEQRIFIGVNCAKKGVVIHEIFHSLGRWHEHSRPDREQYITINYDKILKGYERDFERTNPVFVTNQGIPYDFDSLLHYKADAFTSDGSPTLKPRDPSIELSRLGQREGFSENDLLHVKSLYCPDGRGHWSSWSSWSSCSRTCNGGIQSRTRVCVGGIDCKGLNIEERECGQVDCPILPVWSTWSDWSSCSSSCGTGRRSRVRWCVNGTMCTNGTSHQFEDCHLTDCPEAPVWNSWSSWSDCSQSCQSGGYRFRTRRCRNGSDKDCTGPSTQYQTCNTDVPCSSNNGEEEEEKEGEVIAIVVWSQCSKSCGSGVQYMIVGNGTVTRPCNTQPCHNEYCLKGIKHQGCYQFNKIHLNSLESTHPLLMDPPNSRDNPVTKCAYVTHSHSHTSFALSGNTCYMYSASNGSMNQSNLCHNGTGNGGNNTNNTAAIDVYMIDDTISFIDSVNRMNVCGSDYCKSNDTVAECTSILLSLSPASVCSTSYIILLLFTIISLINLL